MHGAQALFFPLAFVEANCILIKTSINYEKNDEAYQQAQ